MVFIVQCIGSNGNFQLGLDNDDDHENWQLAAEVEHRPHIVCGGNHTLMLTNHSIYSCGDNAVGQCGFNNTDTDKVIGFRQLNFELSNWINVSAGWDFSLFCNDDNEIWCSGQGLNGELGLGKDTTTQLGPVLMSKLEDSIIKIKSSLHHTIVQLSNGEVYGWGNNKKQQIMAHDGHKSNRIVWRPVKLDLIGVVDFTLGRDFSLFKLQDGSYIYQGKDSFNIGSQISQYENYTILALRSMWSSVHMLVRVNKGDEIPHIISLGNNSHGQLLRDHSQVKVDKFDVGSEHGLILSKDTVYTWGWGEHGNCGPHSTGLSRKEQVVFDYLNEVFRLEATSTNSAKIIDVYGGCATSWIVIERQNN